MISYPLELRLIEELESLYVKIERYENLLKSPKDLDEEDTILIKKQVPAMKKYYNILRIRFSKLRKDKGQI